MSEYVGDCTRHNLVCRQGLMQQETQRISDCVIICPQFQHDLSELDTYFSENKHLEGGEANDSQVPHESQEKKSEYCLAKHQCVWIIEFVHMKYCLVDEYAGD